MDEQKNKNIDESWKETVEKEKQKNDLNKGKDDFIPPGPDFNFFITTLALQASIFFGQIPNPATGKNEENITQAKFIIDTLIMLKDKTKGNLSEEETTLLENVLYELRMQYIEKAGKSGR